MINEIVEFAKSNKRYIKMFFWIVGIIIAMNIKKILDNVPDYIKTMLTHNLFRSFTMCLAIYIYTEDIKTAIIVSLVFYLASYFTGLLNIKEYFTLLIKPTIENNIYIRY